MACDPLMLVVSPLVSYIYPAKIGFVFFLVYDDYPIINDIYSYDYYSIIDNYHG